MYTWMQTCKHASHNHTHMNPFTCILHEQQVYTHVHSCMHVHIHAHSQKYHLVVLLQMFRRSARLLSLCVIALCVALGHASVIRDMAFDALEIEQGQKGRTDGRSSTGRTEHATSLHVVAKIHLQLTWHKSSPIWKLTNTPCKHRLCFSATAIIAKTWAQSWTKWVQSTALNLCVSMRHVPQYRGDTTFVKTAQEWTNTHCKKMYIYIYLHTYVYACICTRKYMRMHDTVHTLKHWYQDPQSMHKYAYTYTYTRV